MGYATQLDIVNRALQKLGKPRVATTAELTPQAQETLFAYDKLRRYEMRRNPWVFTIRTVALRALDQYMQQLTFANWATGATYSQNDIITGSDGQLYISLVAANLGNDPTSTTGSWTLYFGPVIATPFPSTWSGTPTYAKYDIVQGSDSNYYRSLAGGNLNHNPVGDGGVHWLLLSTSTTTGVLPAFTDYGFSFYAGELVFTSGGVYIALVSNVAAASPDPYTDTAGNWMLLTSRPTTAPVNFIYPIGSGPSTQVGSRNVFILPNGYLRHVPQAPKDSFNAWLGGPSALPSDDWNFENNCFTSGQVGPILFRFAADVFDPSLFDAMFAEGFACRIAEEMAPAFEVGEEKIKRLQKDYRSIMGEARTVNGIESGPVAPPLDEYIAVRK